MVWRRFGKEHGEEGGFKLNSPDVVSAHIQQKVDKFRQTPADDWRWWQLSDEIIIEKPSLKAGLAHPKIIYYLIPKNWALVEDPGFYYGEELGWYVHVGDLTYDGIRGCWIFTDLFCDVIVKKDNRTHSVLDLGDLGYALELGLITANKTAQILTDTQKLIDLVRSGDFPPKEIYDSQKALDELGWIEK